MRGIILTKLMMTQTVIKINPTAISTEVEIYASGWHDKLSDPKAICRTAVIATWHAIESSVMVDINEYAVELSVRLTNDEEMTKLNKIFRERNEPTNVLSFPAIDEHAINYLPPDAPLLLGDVVIALGVTEREAKEQNKSLANHLRHLVVHGTLHLFGYNHTKKNDIEVMENLEKTVCRLHLI